MDRVVYFEQNIFMIKETIQPRFSDTDALGHINNASFLSWFEDAKKPIFKLFVPGLDPKKWNLILARVEIDYLKQTYYQQKVELEAVFEKIGNSSMTLIQRAIQNGDVVAQCKSILVHFDYASEKSTPIPTEIRKELEKHLI